MGLFDKLRHCSDGDNPMTEKLYRKIAASDPWVPTENIYGQVYQVCYWCKHEKGEDVEHAPGCDYIWCREWVKQRDAGKIFLSAKEVMKHYFPKWHKEQQEARQKYTNYMDETIEIIATPKAVSPTAPCERSGISGHGDWGVRDEEPWDQFVKSVCKIERAEQLFEHEIEFCDRLRVLEKEHGFEKALDIMVGRLANPSIIRNDGIQNIGIRVDPFEAPIIRNEGKYPEKIIIPHWALAEKGVGGCGTDEQRAEAKKAFVDYYGEMHIEQKNDLFPVTFQNGSKIIYQKGRIFSPTEGEDKGRIFMEFSEPTYKARSEDVHQEPR
jgi:hypothetical protein